MGGPKGDYYPLSFSLGGPPQVDLLHEGLNAPSQIPAQEQVNRRTQGQGLPAPKMSEADAKRYLEMLEALKQQNPVAADINSSLDTAINGNQFYDAFKHSKEAQRHDGERKTDLDMRMKALEAQKEEAKVARAVQLWRAGQQEQINYADMTPATMRTYTELISKQVPPPGPWPTAPGIPQGTYPPKR